MTTTIDSNIAEIARPARRAPRRHLTGGVRIAAQIGVILATVAVAGMGGMLAG